MHEPLIRMIKDLSETGKETAKTMYNSRGWVAHHNTDIWRITGEWILPTPECGLWAEPGFHSIYGKNIYTAETKTIYEPFILS
jgi:alpha-L-fucosidase 2